MDIARKIGIGIVMIIPGFVFGAIIWEWFGSWIAVLILEIIIAVLYYYYVIAGSLSGPAQRA